MIYYEILSNIMRNHCISIYTDCFRLGFTVVRRNQNLKDLRTDIGYLDLSSNRSWGRLLKRKKTSTVCSHPSSMSPMAPGAATNKPGLADGYKTSESG